MIVKDIMTENPEYISPDSTLHDAAIKLRDLDIGMIPVGDGVILTGMLTDRDITVRATAEGLDPKLVPVSEVMTPTVIYVYEDQDLEEAIQVMEKEQIRRLIVLNREKSMTGIVALADLAKIQGGEEQKAKVLEGVSSD